MRSSARCIQVLLALLLLLSSSQSRRILVRRQADLSSSSTSSVVVPRPPRPEKSFVEKFFFEGVASAVHWLDGFDQRYLDPILFPGIAQYYNNAPPASNNQKFRDPTDGKRLPRPFAEPVDDYVDA